MKLKLHSHLSLYVYSGLKMIMNIPYIVKLLPSVIGGDSRFLLILGEECTCSDSRLASFIVDVKCRKS